MISASARVFFGLPTCVVVRLAVAAVVALALARAGYGQEAQDHPRLVSVDAARCTVCHDDLVDKAVVHAAAADDCTTCHEFSTSESGTRVALADAEPQLCVMCHDGLEAAAGGVLETPHYPVTESCVTCHDPHSSDEARLLHARIPELCSACHDVEDIGESHGGQLTESTDCAQCHEVHGSSRPRMLSGEHRHAPFADGDCEGCHRAPFGSRIRLRARGERLCEACHGDVAAAERETGVVHPALRGERGRAGCLSCHDPHMAAQSGLLREPGTELCRGCHDRIVQQATAETGHPPAAEDCTNCHQPHAAAEPALLDAPPAELCRACHDAADAELVGAHLGADLETLECTQCHTPHGTGHEKLLAENLHAPVVDGCDTCHEGAWNEVMEDGESSLCLMCHDDIGEAAAKAAVPHAAMEVARCADCHNPHASPNDRLVKLAGGEVCTQCHDDKVAGPGEFAHGVIDMIGCQACHEPHGGEHGGLLRVQGDDLCRSCHDSQLMAIPDEGTAEVEILGRFLLPADLAKRMAVLSLSADGQEGHPIASHRVAGTPSKEELKRGDTDFAGELSCLTCHDPHKARSERLFQWNAGSRMEICVRCHKK